MVILLTIGFIVILTLLVTWFIFSMRRIVPTNEVHIVQRRNNTVPYGNEFTKQKSNVYYQVPMWVPKYGVCVSKLPTTISDISLRGYQVYDKSRTPFVIDLLLYYRISDFNLASMRVFSMNDLKNQLEGVLKCLLRNSFAKEDYNEIFNKRTRYSNEFTVNLQEIYEKEWGVTPIQLEILDIRIPQEGEPVINF